MTENDPYSDKALAPFRKQPTDALIRAFRQCGILSRQLAEVLHERYLDAGGAACSDPALKELIDTEIDPDPPGLG